MLTTRLTRSCGCSKILHAKDFKFASVASAASTADGLMTPKKIFEMLDKRVVGQAAAKRMLAIAYSS